jgi:hypothetical protein
MLIDCDKLHLTAQIFTICNKTIFEMISSISMWHMLLVASTHQISCIANRK